MPINWEADQAEPAPIAQLQAEAELLRLVQYWRERYEALAELVAQTVARS